MTTPGDYTGPELPIRGIVVLSEQQVQEEWDRVTRNVNTSLEGDVKMADKPKDGVHGGVDWVKLAFVGFLAFVALLFFIYKIYYDQMHPELAGADGRKPVGGYGRDYEEPPPRPFVAGYGPAYRGGVSRPAPPPRQGPPVVHGSEFNTGQEYCNKAIRHGIAPPGSRFIKWIGSGASRRARCG